MESFISVYIQIYVTKVQLMIANSLAASTATIIDSVEALSDDLSYNSLSSNAFNDASSDNNGYGDNSGYSSNANGYANNRNSSSN